MKLVWRITKMDGLNKSTEYTIPAGTITESRINELLIALAAKTLDLEDIIPCYLRKNSKNYSRLLEIQSDKKHRTKQCGENPYFVASMVDENGEILKCPELK